MSNHFSAANLQHPGDDARVRPHEDLLPRFPYLGPPNS